MAAHGILGVGLPRKGDFQLCRALVHWICGGKLVKEGCTITRSTMHTLDIVNITVLESVMPSQ